MRIGLLARCDNRGIAYQTHEFYRHMCPHRTLVMCLNDPLWPEETARYNDHFVDFVEVSTDRSMSPRKVVKMLREVDVLFAVETLMDWYITDLAHQAGVRVVVQGNPEFYVHQRFGFPHPDKWVWPTRWMIDEMPSDEMLIVPTPDDCPVQPGDPTKGPLRVLHVAGHAAAGDRNGTIDFISSLRYIQGEVIVTVVSQDHWIPEPIGMRDNVTLLTIPSGVVDRWEMYAGQHMIVQPRKYGGLCLPANEACRVGCAVVMPDCSPNDAWPGPRLQASKGRLHRAPWGAVQTYQVDPRQIASTIDQFDRHRDGLADEMAGAHIWGMTNTWAHHRKTYLTTLSA